MEIMSVREQILGRLRASGGPSMPLPEIRTPVRAVADPIDLFTERAAAVGARVVTTALGRFAEVLADDLRRQGTRVVAICDDPLLTPLTPALAAAGIEVISPSQASRVRLAEVDAGITTADYAIAATGTLVLTCSPQRPRSTSLLPPLHIAVLPQDRVVPTFAHLFDNLRMLPSALTFITGPSRTADIELTPVQGVHGPTSVQVYLLA